ncbi:small VCP/p97-interacting protein-like [Haliotis rubra]|uniref:small VCP/p97-interacting protein-like n=1 Tax=Haliotis rubra TaxID=36100 RepID=UPI001EE5F904|nr:small VCP/p97-interacting protein-like [Haliotis rubra]
MGMCLPCLGSSVEDYDQPDPETRRQQQAEAVQFSDSGTTKSRGVKDVEGLKRKQQRREEIEKKAEIQGGGDNAMRWQVG